jgi:ArsR family transcriptional regulator
MGQSRISRHLKLLSEAGLLRVEKQGTWHYYRLAPGEGLFSEIWPNLATRLGALECQDQDNAGVLEVMMARRRRSQDFFDRHARDWDNLHSELLSLPDYRDNLCALVPAGGLLVEIGVGTGSLLPLLAGRGRHIIGIDHSPSMVALARELVLKNGLGEQVEIRLAEMNHLPLADGEVRTVIMNQVLHHAEQPAEILREIGRVLEPQGRLVLADLTRHQKDWVRQRLADQWLGFKRSELEQWLAEAGLSLATYQEFGKSGLQQPVFLLSAGVAGDCSA